MTLVTLRASARKMSDQNVSAYLNIIEIIGANEIEYERSFEMRGEWNDRCEQMHVAIVDLKSTLLDDHDDDEIDKFG